jgi:hypothetical protein
LNTVRPSDKGNENDKPQTPSLRATAQEFTPNHVLQQDLARLVQDSALDYRPEDAWSSLSPRIRQNIFELRRFHKQVAGEPQVDTGHATTSGTTESGLNDRMDTMSAASLGLTFIPSSSGSEHGHWMAQSVDEKQFKPTFGRAPPPIWPQLEQNSHRNTFTSHPRPGTFSSPSNSFSSAEVSPASTLGSMGSPSTSWTFGSPNTNGVTEGIWAGGDGHEIAFIGDGARAERHRRFNKSVRANHYHRQQNYVGNYRPAVNPWQMFTSPHARIHDASAPRLVGAGYDDFPPASFQQETSVYSPASPPLAPRSRQQWLDMSRGAKPCGNVEFMSAMETLPFMTSTSMNDAQGCKHGSFGLCGSCAIGGEVL